MPESVEVLSPESLSGQATQEGQPASRSPRGFANSAVQLTVKRREGGKAGRLGRREGWRLEGVRRDSRL